MVARLRYANVSISVRDREARRMKMGTWETMSSRLFGFAAPVVMCLAIVGCSSAPTDDSPTVESPVRGAPNAATDTPDKTENPDKPVGVKPIFSAGDFRDPGDAPAPPSASS